MKAGYLECERRYTFWLLIFVAGWYGAYTFFLRGGVFCNAQTANVVLFAMCSGKAGMALRSLFAASYQCIFLRIFSL